MIRGLLETSGTSPSISPLSVPGFDLRGAARLLLWAPRAVWGFGTKLALRETQQTPPCFQEIFLFFLFVNINYKQNRLKMEKPGPICHHEKSACCLIPSTESANPRRDPSISLATVLGPSLLQMLKFFYEDGEGSTEKCLSFKLTGNV